MKVGISSKTMTPPGFVSMAQSEPSKGIGVSYPIATSPHHNFPSIEYEGQSSMVVECSSRLSFPSNSPRSEAKSASSSPSVFCTSLYFSSSSASETQRQLGNFPFLPHPPTHHQFISSANSSTSPSVFSEDLSNPYNDAQSEVIMKDFLNLPANASSDGCFYGMHCQCDDFAITTEQLELQFLSDELDIAITDHGENKTMTKYRLAKYMPEKKEEKKTSCISEEKKAASSGNGIDGKKKEGMHITEALRMQMEVQKQLHEQLELQRSLQLRIEEHARYLQKILEEQQKAGNALIPSISLSIPTDSNRNYRPEPSSPSKVISRPKPCESKTESSTSPPSKHNANDCNPKSNPKRPRIDEAEVQNPVQ